MTSNILPDNELPFEDAKQDSSSAVSESEQISEENVYSKLDEYAKQAFNALEEELNITQFYYRSKKTTLQITNALIFFLKINRKPLVKVVDGELISVYPINCNVTLPRREFEQIFSLPGMYGEDIKYIFDNFKDLEVITLKEIAKFIPELFCLSEEISLRPGKVRVKSYFEILTVPLEARYFVAAALHQRELQSPKILEYQTLSRTLTIKDFLITAKKAGLLERVSEYIRLYNLDIDSQI